MQDKQTIVLHTKGFQLTVPSQRRYMVMFPNTYKTRHVLMKDDIRLTF